MCSQLKASCVLNEGENLPVLSDTCDLNDSDNLPVLSDTGDHPAQCDPIIGNQSSQPHPYFKKESLSFYNINSFNARSLKNKLGELQCLLKTSNSDINCITETWLNPSIQDSVVIGDTNFSIFRKDRFDNREGGGVCVLINDATVKAVPVLIPPKFVALELIAVDIISSTSVFRLFVAYRPPCGSDLDPISLAYTSLPCECIESLIPVNSTFVLCGDFNFPKINWSSSSNVLTNLNSCSGIFVDFFINTFYLNLSLTQQGIPLIRVTRQFST